MNESFDGLAQQADSAPHEIRKIYDDWAPDYDVKLRQWGYEAPEIAATRLADLVAQDVAVLDVGCGTGLVGVKLQAAGFARIVGVDFSEESLAVAKARNIYQAVRPVDLTRLPTDIETGAYGALVCIGVMSYLPDVEALAREFCRVTTPGAGIILTQRSDIFDARGTQAAFDTLAAEGLWEEVEVTGDRPYLPGNPEFEGVDVRYCVFRRQ